VIRWLVLGLWYAAILFTSSLASTPTTIEPMFDYLINKAGHVFVYAFLGWLLADALTAPVAGFAVRKRAALALTIVLGAGLASVDETRQSFVYGRTGMLSDVILDTVATSGGALLHHWLVPRTGPAPLDEAAGDLCQQGAIEGEHQELHREDLAVAVDVRQERHHDRQVDHHEQVERQGAQRPSGG
jgi:VanZ family protein